MLVMAVVATACGTSTIVSVGGISTGGRSKVGGGGGGGGVFFTSSGSNTAWTGGRERLDGATGKAGHQRPQDEQMQQQDRSHHHATSRKELGILFDISSHELLIVVLSKTPGLQSRHRS